MHTLKDKLFIVHTRSYKQKDNNTQTSATNRMKRSVNNMKIWSDLKLRVFNCNLRLS